MKREKERYRQEYRQSSKHAVMPGSSLRLTDERKVPSVVSIIPTNPIPRKE